MGTVRIPQTGGRKALGYAKLIAQVDRTRSDGFAFTAKFLRPGSVVDEAEIRPPGWPDPPLLLEYVPPEGKARGWKAHEQSAEHILWTWRAKTGDWTELGRVSAVGGDQSWVHVLKPMALAHLAPPSLVWRRTMAEARERIVAAVDAELEALEGGEGHRSALLSIVHDVIASRAAFLPEILRGDSGESVGSDSKQGIKRPTYTSLVDISSFFSYKDGAADSPSGVGDIHPMEWGNRTGDSPSGVGESHATLEETLKNTLAYREEYRVESDPVQETTFNDRDRQALIKAGKLGAVALMQKTSPEWRRARAKKASAARWAKKQQPQQQPEAAAS